jgi:Alpha/beta hydrolase domain
MAFACTNAEREKTTDRRRSNKERYQSKDDYVTQVKAVSAGLVGARLLLAEDAERYVEAAMRVDENLFSGQ